MVQLYFENDINKFDDSKEKKEREILILLRSYNIHMINMITYQSIAPSVGPLKIII